MPFPVLSQQLQCADYLVQNLERNLMTQPTKAICAAAQKLSPVERLDLIDQLLESLDASDPSMDVLWAKEADARLSAYRRGEIRALPLAEVLAKYQRL